MIKNIKGIEVVGISCCVPKKKIINKNIRNHKNIKRIIKTIGIEENINGIQTPKIFNLLDKINWEKISNGLPVRLAPVTPGAKPTTRSSDSISMIDGTGALNQVGCFFLFSLRNFFNRLHFEQFFLGSFNLLPFFNFS